MSRTLRTAAALLILLVGIAAAYLILTYAPPPAGEAPSAEAPARPQGAPPEVRIASWNVLNLGASKDDAEIAFMAKTLRAYDLVALQEVVTAPAGAQAVARLVDALDRTGADWDYALSEPTTGRGSERYAFLWKPSRVRLVGRPWLDPTLADPLDREPFLARFEVGQTGYRLLLASFHAVPRDKDPATEIRALVQLHAAYEADHVVIAGDFNLSAAEEAFAGLRARGYVPALVGQRTSLRMKRGRDGRHLANEYDNLLVETGPLRVLSAGADDFTPAFRTLPEARDISDHLPVYATITWN